jgi:hypothetical protein
METMERKKSRPVPAGRSPRSSRSRSSSAVGAATAASARRPGTSTSVRRQYGRGSTKPRPTPATSPASRPRNGPNSSSCVGGTGGCVRQDLQGWRGYEQRRPWTPSSRHTQTPAKRGPLGISHLDVEHDVNSMIRSISPHESHTQRCQFPKTQLICRKALGEGFRWQTTVSGG